MLVILVKMIYAVNSTTFEIFKMAAIAMETTKNTKKFKVLGIG
jgi:hypothetical protein